MANGPTVRVHVQTGISPEQIHSAAERLLEQLQADSRMDFPAFQLAVLDGSGNVVEKTRICNENRNVLRSTPSVIYFKSK
jgi:hypothetical protein